MQPNVPVGAVVPATQDFVPVGEMVNVAFWFVVVGAIENPLAQLLPAPSVNESTVKAVYVAVPVSAAVTLHSFNAVTRAFFP